MELWPFALLGLLLLVPFGRVLLKLWVVLSLVLVWLLDAAAGDVLGD